MDDGIISLKVSLPGKLCDYFIGSSITCDLFGVNLSFDTVEVFVKTVKNEIDQFLGVLLGVAKELKGYLIMIEFTVL